MKNKKHPELWSLSIDKTRWIDKFIHPQMRVKDWDGIITEAKEKSDIWTFPVFTKEFCEMIIEEAEQVRGVHEQVPFGLQAVAEEAGHPAIVAAAQKEGAASAVLQTGKVLLR